MTIELNEQEAQVLLQLIDIAVKSGGLAVAEASIILSKKITEASKPQELLADKLEK